MTKPDPYIPISWNDGSVQYIDQTLLPHTVLVRQTRRFEDIVDAIRSLAVRGAPLIGIAGAYAVVLAARSCGGDKRTLLDAIGKIGTARPTAVNLSRATARMLTRLSPSERTVTAESVQALLTEALRIHEQERSACEALSDHGATLFTEPVDVLTICNTGPLATGGAGTAFGVIHKAWALGRVRKVYACETRPLLQGARLTMWELEKHGIPGLLINDGAAGHFFQRGDIGAVITGADRIAANGDVANKVGTYTLAVLAAAHNVPMYVAAPTSTIDPVCSGGSSIPIEERSAAEVTHCGGVRVAPEGAQVAAPAFDVTPATLVSAIVTERGIHRKPFSFGTV